MSDGLLIRRLRFRLRILPKELNHLLCPVCKADNAAGPACRRCKADLGMLFALEDRRAGLLAETARAFENHHHRQALEFAKAADQLRSNEETRCWLALLNLIAENFGEAWAAYQSTGQHG